MDENPSYQWWVITLSAQMQSMLSFVSKQSTLHLWMTQIYLAHVHNSFLKVVIHAVGDAPSPKRKQDCTDIVIVCSVYYFYLNLNEIHNADR